MAIYTISIPLFSNFQKPHRRYSKRQSIKAYFANEVTHDSSLSFVNISDKEIIRILVVLSINTYQTQDWVLDLGASQYFVSDPKLFSKLELNST